MESDQECLPISSAPPSEAPPVLPPPVPARHLPKPQDFYNHSDNEEAEIEVDNDISQQMTASYSEISFKSDLSTMGQDLSPSLTLDAIPLEDEILQRPVSLSCTPKIQAFSPLNLEGSVHLEGNMTHFVTEDLEYKIKLSSPVGNKRVTSSLSTSSKNATPNILYKQLLVSQAGAFDAALLTDLECEAQHVATSIDNLTENLCGILHSISSITADNVDIYKDSVAKMSDSMDANIKSMYTMMAKAEEVTQAMKAVNMHANRIKEIRRLVDLFESYV